MPEHAPGPAPKNKHSRLAADVADREKRKLRARKHGAREVWFGLGMFGMVGWAVAVPMVLSVFLGSWIDATWPGRHSWTLMLLVPGTALGCWNAWYWVQKERRDITKWKHNDLDNEHE